jgi:hypothetical protein
MLVYFAGDQKELMLLFLQQMWQLCCTQLEACSTGVQSSLSYCLNVKLIIVILEFNRLELVQCLMRNTSGMVLVSSNLHFLNSPENWTRSEAKRGAHLPFRSFHAMKLFNSPDNWTREGAKIGAYQPIRSFHVRIFLLSLRSLVLALLTRPKAMPLQLITRCWYTLSFLSWILFSFTSMLVLQTAFL